MVTLRGSEPLDSSGCVEIEAFEGVQAGDDGHRKLNTLLPHIIGVVIILVGVIGKNIEKTDEVGTHLESDRGGKRTNINQLGLYAKHQCTG